METKDKDNTWHLIRNDNGEWICDDKVVFLSRFEAGILQVLAAQNGKPFSIQVRISPPLTQSAPKPACCICRSTLGLAHAFTA